MLLVLVVVPMLLCGKKEEKQILLKRGKCVTVSHTSCVRFKFTVTFSGSARLTTYGKGILAENP